MGRNSFLASVVEATEEVETDERGYLFPNRYARIATVRYLEPSAITAAMLAWREELQREVLRSTGLSEIL